MNSKIQDITLIHEHMSVSLSDGDLGSAPFDILSEELTSLYAMGVHRIVDMTNQVMGRNVRLCERLEETTGIEIVIGHMDLSCNINEILNVLKTGVTVGIDTIGKEMPAEMSFLTDTR